MDPLDELTLASFPVVTVGDAGATRLPVTQVNLQLLAEQLVLAIAKINELVTAVEDLTGRVETLEAPPE